MNNEKDELLDSINNLSTKQKKFFLGEIVERADSNTNCMKMLANVVELAEKQKPYSNITYKSALIRVNTFETGESMFIQTISNLDQSSLETLKNDVKLLHSNEKPFLDKSFIKP